jgi:hypothetical protein
MWRAARMRFSASAFGKRKTGTLAKLGFRERAG